VNAGDMAFIRQFPKTNTAQFKGTHIAVFTAATPTTPHYSGAELWFLF